MMTSLNEYLFWLMLSNFIGQYFFHPKNLLESRAIANTCYCICALLWHLRKRVNINMERKQHMKDKKKQFSIIVHVCTESSFQMKIAKRRIYFQLKWNEWNKKKLWQKSETFIIVECSMPERLLVYSMMLNTEHRALGNCKMYAFLNILFAWWNNRY